MDTGQKNDYTFPTRENRSGGMTHTNLSRIITQVRNTHNPNILTEHIVSRWAVL